MIRSYLPRQPGGEDEVEQARILENYRKINTKNKAQAYVKYIRDKIEATKKKRSAEI